MSWGVYPAAMIGHSLGEYVAACIGGTFDRDSALRLLARRASMMQSLPSGSMLAIKAPAEQLTEFLSPATSIAAFNTPNLVVVSGENASIAELDEQLQRKGIASRPLQTSHAFHSSMMEPIISKFADVVRSCSPKPPQRPWISSLTGAPISDLQAIDPNYWAQQLRQPVRFADGIRHLLDTSMVLLEVGPGQTLATLARQQPGRQFEQILIASLPEESRRSRSAANGPRAAMVLRHRNRLVALSMRAGAAAASHCRPIRSRGAGSGSIHHISAMPLRSRPVCLRSQ